MNQWPDAATTLPDDGTEGRSSVGSGDPASDPPSSPYARPAYTT